MPRRDPGLKFSVDRCPKFWPIGANEVRPCALSIEHEGKCHLRSIHGVLYCVPGEIDMEIGPESQRHV